MAINPIGRVSYDTYNTAFTFSEFLDNLDDGRAVMNPDRDIRQAKQHSQPPADAVLSHLAQILSAAEFRSSKKLSDFLQFVIEETLAGRSDCIKQYTIATKVFGRDRDFDQHNDPIVRVQAAKIRRALQRFYFEEGKSAPIRIDIPKGTYVPLFSHQDSKADVSSRMERDEPGPPVISVAPFTNKTGDTTVDYLALGFGEDLTTELSRFSNVAVITHQSTESCLGCDQSVCELSRTLAAEYLICGSLRQAEDFFRLNVQLLSANTGKQLWAERFRRPLTAADLFDVQDNIIHCILSRVVGAFGIVHNEMARRSRWKENASLSGYEAVLRALAHAKSTIPDRIAEVIDALECAVRTEPDFAPAWAHLGICYLDSVAFGVDICDDALRRGMECADRALTLDPHSQDTHFAVSWACLLRDDRDGLAGSARKMIELNPGHAFMLGVGGWFLALAGHRKEGMERIEQARRLDSNQPGWFHFIAYLDSVEQEDYEAAHREARMLRMPELFWDPLLQAAALGQLGRHDEAAHQLQNLLTLRPDFEQRATFFIRCFVLSDTLVQRILEGLSAAGLGSTMNT